MINVQVHTKVDEKNDLWIDVDAYFKLLISLERVQHHRELVVEERAELRRVLDRNDAVTTSLRGELEDAKKMIERSPEDHPKKKRAGKKSIILTIPLDAQLTAADREQMPEDDVVHHELKEIIRNTSTSQLSQLLHHIRTSGHFLIIPPEEPREGSDEVIVESNERSA